MTWLDGHARQNDCAYLPQVQLCAVQPGRTIIGDAQSGEPKYSVGVGKSLACSNAHRQHRLFVLLACATCSYYRAYVLGMCIVAPSASVYTSTHVPVDLRFVQADPCCNLSLTGPLTCLWSLATQRRLHGGSVCALLVQERYNSVVRSDGCGEP